MKRQRGFSLIELLIVVGVILIIATIAIPNLLRAKMAANESSAVASLRAITTAEIAYSTACPDVGFAANFTDLHSGVGCPAMSGQIDDALASGTKSSYKFYNYTTQGTPAIRFSLNADPIGFMTRARYFFVDESGVIRYSTTSAATNASNALGN